MKRLLFAALSGCLTVLFLLTIWQDTHRQWSRYQRRFLRTLATDERRGLTGGIKQLLVTDLRRVDRCTTCHLAIAKPQLALAEEPFTAHPGEFLAWHPPETFGCTVCHGGQGLATEASAAHGDEPHWEEPLLRGRLVQASCAQCHGDVPRIAEHIPLYVRGRELFKVVSLKFVELVQETATRAGCSVSDFDLLVPHQMNLRILENAAARLGIPMERVFVNIDRYGNTSSASVPIALDEARRLGRIGKGSRVLLVAFGGGLTWASTVLEW